MQQVHTLRTMILQKTGTAFLFLLSTTNIQGINAGNPARNPDLVKGRTLIKTWIDSGVNYTAYGYGELISHIRSVGNNKTVTISDWSAGTGIELSEATINEKDQELSGVSVLNKRVCRNTVSYYTENPSRGSFQSAWKCIGGQASHGGAISYCDGIITSPDVNFSFGLNRYHIRSLGILSRRRNK